MRSSQVSRLEYEIKGLYRVQGTRIGLELIFHRIASRHISACFVKFTFPTSLHFTLHSHQVLIFFSRCHRCNCMNSNNSWEFQFPNSFQFMHSSGYASFEILVTKALVDDTEFSPFILTVGWQMSEVNPKLDRENVGINYLDSSSQLKCVADDST